MLKKIKKSKKKDLKVFHINNKKIEINKKELININKKEDLKLIRKF
jgi:molybdopterin-guanine dinucleotide biosynthesis protein A